MATVTGVTAARAQEIQDESIVSAEIVGNDLIFTKGDEEGTTVNAGRVIPPAVLSWPIGSIFMNTSSTNPATLLGGGTWVRWGKGRVPVSLDETQTEFDIVEETGGAKTHTLTSSQVPKHSHEIMGMNHVGAPTGPQWYLQTSDGNDPANPYGYGYDTKSSGGTGTDTVGGSGPAESHNNLQPYITVYMWKRTA